MANNNAIARLFEYHASDNYHRRAHRARSVILSQDELVEIRAAQRTFEGAYTRTALGAFSFSLVILKIFTAEFYSVGALFALYGAGILGIALLRRKEGNQAFFVPGHPADDENSQSHAHAHSPSPGSGETKFRTSGNVVVVMTGLSLGAYVGLLVLISRLGT